MYSRSYPRPSQGSIPPNYSGNAFELADERKRQGGPPEPQELPECERKEARPAALPDEYTPSRPIANPISALFSRSGGRHIEWDDILLAGLIIMLISGGADEDIILLLGFLFLCGF